MKLDKPRAGDRFVVQEPFEAIVAVHWRAPFTSGCDRTLQEGLEFTVLIDPPPEATAIAAQPSDVGRWESELVPEEDRTADKYGGYSLVISFDNLLRHCAAL